MSGYYQGATIRRAVIRWTIILPGKTGACCMRTRSYILPRAQVISSQAPRVGDKQSTEDAFLFCFLVSGIATHLIPKQVGLKTGSSVAGGLSTEHEPLGCFTPSDRSCASASCRICFNVLNVAMLSHDGIPHRPCFRPWACMSFPSSTMHRGCGAISAGI